jgi:hypothetical protein
MKFLPSFNTILLEKSTGSVEKHNIEIINKHTIKRGYIFDNSVFENLSVDDVKSMMLLIKKETNFATKTGINNAFHKSWEKIINSSIEELVAEQILHYFSTYCMEALGFANSVVYVPVEKLSVPKINIDKFPIVVITVSDYAQMRERIFTMINSGIALKADTIATIVEVLNIVGYTESQLANVKNKETKCILYAGMNDIPSNNVEFLRFLVYTNTNTTLLIKNDKLISQIKANAKEHACTTVKLLKLYNLRYGYTQLSEIFNRFKPIFLALKTDESCQIINKIGKLSKTNHKPYRKSFVESITSVPYTETEIVTNLETCNIFQKIRMLHALNYKASGNQEYLYRIRNGKSYAKLTPNKSTVDFENVARLVYCSIIESFKHLNGKTVYIPQGITYAMPSSEKMFTGNVPSGTSVEIERDIVFGIHWYNLDTKRVDLDLKMLSISGAIGWDGYYKTNNVVFSGDMTDAQLPHGASEFFRIIEPTDAVYAITCNYYNSYGDDSEIPYSIIVGVGSDVESPRMLNPNKIKCAVPTKVTKEQQIVGLIVATKETNKFFFVETSLGSGKSSSETDYMQIARTYIHKYYQNINSCSLNDVLELAGCKVVHEKTDQIDIDLSMQSLTKDSFIAILSSN